MKGVLDWLFRALRRERPVLCLASGRYRSYPVTDSHVNRVVWHDRFFVCGRVGGTFRFTKVLSQPVVLCKHNRVAVRRSYLSHVRLRGRAAIDTLRDFYPEAWA